MSEITRLEKAKRRAESKNNLREVANLCNLLGQEYVKDGDFEEALAQHREEASLCSALEDTIGLAVANRCIGEVFCEMGQWDKALRYQHRHLTLAKEADSLVEEQRAHATIGRTHLQRAEVFGVNGQKKEQMEALSDSEKSFLSSLSVCKRLQGTVDMREHNEMRCRLYLNLGLVLESRGNDKEALRLIGQSLELTSANGLHEDAHRCHTSRAGILLRKGNLSEALQEGQRALNLAAKLHNKASQCEAHCFLAQVHLANSDYEAAKKCCYKAYKLKHPSLEDRKRIESQLKVVVSLCDADDALILLSDTQLEEKLKLYEKCGDGLAKLTLFSKAIEYYHLMLKAANELNKDPSSLAPIYLSLAQTYSDNKDYQNAIDYYMKEYDIKINVDPADACRTLMNVAIARENKGDDYAQLEDIYKQARDAATKADNKRLECKVLQFHTLLNGIPEHRKAELEEQMKVLIDVTNVDPDAETSEEEGCNSEEDIDLELVHFSDSENDQENFYISCHSRQKRTFAVKRNEKGETPLHKACIAGNLSMVKRLLQQGHPVNPRDNCGWLPLHEAANHGFCDIVNLLLDAGAWINDRGGKFCDGISPIHDAAACGNMEVVRLLMSRGASLIVKANDGSTPYESLVKYRQRSNLSKSEENECNMLENEMRELISRTGHKVPSVSSQASSSHGKRSPSTTRRSSDDRNQRRASSSSDKRRMSSEETSEAAQASTSRDIFENDSDDDLPDIGSPSLVEESREPLVDDIYNSEEFTVNPLLDDVQDESTSATSTYLNAIGSVGSAAQRVEIQKRSSSWIPTSRDKKMALVTSTEDVGDDWLDDDLGRISKKRKRTDKFEFDYKESRNERREIQPKNTLEKPLKLKKTRQTKLTSVVERSTRVNSNRFSVLDDVSSPGNVSSDLVTIEDAPSLNNRHIQSNPVMSRSDNVTTPAVSGGGALRLKVRVQNRLLLVPVAGACQGRTVGWLAEEVTRRYYQLAGLRPHLTLTTQDGAVLDSNDPITLVLPNEQDELHAQVTGWDLPPLPERYTQACQALGSVPVPSLTTVLRQTEASMTLDLSRFCRLTTQLHPVIRAIQCQQSLHSISLSKIRLGDDGFNYLMEALPTLPSLEVLELKVSSLSTANLFTFTEAITSGELTLKALASLDMSYNNFSGAKVSDIFALLSLPALQELSLKHCYFSITGQNQLPIASSTVKKLSLDYNVIYEAPLTSLLSCVPQIRKLSLSGLNSTNDIKVQIHLGVSLASVLGAAEECLLETLDISSCGLTDSDLEDISAYLYRCPHLTSVNLSHNNQLTPASVNALLNELTTNILLPLKSLSLHGIKSSLDVHNKLVSVLQHKATMPSSLASLSVSEIYNNTLETAWNSQNPQKASVKKIGKEVFLSC